MRYFNTSGPNDPKKHYTLLRPKLIQRGINLVKDERYFTIWAPRQTGKSTYFLLLAEELKKLGYKVCWINFEDYFRAPIKNFIDRLTWYLNRDFDFDIQADSIDAVFTYIEKHNDKKCVLIIDEVEGINPEYFGQFLHSIRRVYHNRSHHCLKSVILVGVANITGIVQDNASPFNIADNLEIPYFSREEVWELYGQHEQETGQRFSAEVKDKVYQITAGQPGLVNGFGWKLTNDYPDEPELKLEHYYRVEDWYLTEALDKNVANILNKARQYRTFIEKLLFTETQIPFKIDRPEIKFLHVHGLIKKGPDGNVEFWVPLYKKRVYDAFYPYLNGEKDHILRTLIVTKYLDSSGNLLLDKLIFDYKTYVKRRGFRPFLERDEQGRVVGIKESALLYSFETYISAVVEELGGKIYREADTGLGKTDLLINVSGQEIVVEAKVYTRPSLFERGKRQLSYYCRSLGLSEGYYLVFIAEGHEYPELVREGVEEIEGVRIHTHLIWYDEEKDF